MYKIYLIIRAWLEPLSASDASGDPLAQFSPRELADLPVHHPRS